MTNNISAEKFYKQMRESTKITGFATLIKIEENCTILVQGEDESNFSFGIIFNIGYSNISDNYFKHNPPTPAEMENAIMIVEDEIMPYHKKLAIGSDLLCGDKQLSDYLQLAYPNSPEETRLNRTDIEVLFGRLSAIIGGRPASMDILPTDNEFAARLLIIREALHHLGFFGIQLIK